MAHRWCRGNHALMLSRCRQKASRMTLANYSRALSTDEQLLLVERRICDRISHRGKASSGPAPEWKARDSNWYWLSSGKSPDRLGRIKIAHNPTLHVSGGREEVTLLHRTFIRPSASLRLFSPRSRIAYAGRGRSIGRPCARSSRMPADDRWVELRSRGSAMAQRLIIADGRPVSQSNLFNWLRSARIRTAY
jgi:hypothetical protein